MLEFKTDPEVPPLTLEQVKNFASVILKGDPNEERMIAGTARQALSGVLPTDEY